MISLHSILAATGGLTDVLPTIIFIAVGVLLVLGFVRGFVKGFRMVSWNGLAWLFAGLSFVVIGYVTPLTEGNAAVDFWFSMILAVLCAGGSFALFKVLGYFLRPKMRWIDDDINPDTSLAEYGLEFEPEYIEYDGEHDYQPYGKRIYKSGYGEPSLFFRVLGGIASAVYVGIVLWAALCAGLMIIDASPLKEMVIGEIFQDPTIMLLFTNGKNYLFDYLLIGIMLLTAKEGYSKGLFASLRGIVVTVGGIGSILLSFYLPFSAFAQEGFLAELIVKFSAIFANMGIFGGVLGKLLVGVLLLAVSIIVLVILNILLKTLCNTIENIGITSELDRLLSAALYLLLGAAVCVGILAVFAGFETIGVFHISQLLGDRAFLTNNVLTYMQQIVAPFLEAAK